MKLSSILSKLAALFLCAGMLAPVAGAGEKTILISQSIDLSGPNGALGRDYVAGITTCFDAVNAQGGVLGKRIKYVVQDDRGDPQTAAKNAAEMAERTDYIIGGIGDESTNAILALPGMRNHLLFAPLANPQKEWEGRALIWRPGQRQEIEYLFGWFEKLGIRDVGLSYQEEHVNRQLLQFVQDQISKRGLRLSGVARVHRDNASTEREARALAERKPNLVFSLSDSIGAGLFLRQFRKYAPTTFVAGASLINLPTLVEIAGPRATDWAVFSQVTPNPGAPVTPLQSEHLAMMKRFRDEEANSMTLEGYAVAKSLVKAISLARGGSLQAALSRKQIDLGGFNVTLTPQGGMSNYVDIALLRRGRSLMF
ncbi:ABC transporter substrate-binding protein [Massilia sp. W12]|uniref:ABC transporter substrate-binding protein n=1 Tax=Massilia sp. W12 TaxID=3126507 RepID=UPI0030CD6811